MDWTKEPPKPEELASADWTSVPPSKEELGLKSKTLPLESAARGAAQGASLGFADEVSGGVEALWNKAKGDPAAFGELYKKYRDESRANFKKAKDDNPGAYLGGEFAGAVGTALIPGMQATTPARLAAMGAATGLGNSESEDAQGLATDTALGGATGLALGKGGEVLGEFGGRAANAVRSKVGSGSENLAKRFAARAVGAERATVKKLGPDGVDEIGDYVLKNKLLSPTSSAEDILSKNEDVMTNAMKNRSASYDVIDKAGASKFNPLEAAEHVENKVIGAKNRSYDDTKELVDALDPHLSNILSRGDKNISMQKAQELVESLGKKAKFDTSRSNLSNDVAVDAYFAARNHLNEMAAKGADSIGVSGLKKAIEDSNRTYSTGLKAKALLDNKFAREQGNKLIGLTDTITAAETIGQLGGTKTAAIMAAKKTAERYGAQNAALILEKIGNAAATSPEVANMAAKNPKAFQALVQNVAGKMGISDSVKNVAEEKPKGEEKWARDGFEKLKQHASPEDRARLEAMREQIMKDPKKKKKLISASESKPGSEAMEKIMREINSVTDDEQ